MTVYSDVNEDSWLGNLAFFPHILHARASILYDVNDVTLQKILVSVLDLLQKTSLSLDITVADEEGYVRSDVRFKVGIGNREGFDVLDSEEENRLLARIERIGPFKALDLLLNLHYSVEDGKQHRVHDDEYIARFTFNPGRFEILLHHRKGVRRIDSDELIHLLVDELNKKLSESKYSILEIENIASS